jgi:hypothetical protein
MSAEQKIESFPTNKIQLEIKKEAKMWNHILLELGWANVNAEMDDEGGIILMAFEGDHYIDLLVEKDGVLSYAYDYKNKPIYSLNYQTKSRTLEALRNISKNLTPGT